MKKSQLFNLKEQDYLPKAGPKSSFCTKVFVYADRLSREWRWLSTSQIGRGSWANFTSDLIRPGNSIFSVFKIKPRIYMFLNKALTTLQRTYPCFVSNLKF